MNVAHKATIIYIGVTILIVAIILIPLLIMDSDVCAITIPRELIAGRICHPSGSLFSAGGPT